MKIIVFLISTILLTVTFASCCEDSVKPTQVDPCAGKGRVSASFEIIEVPSRVSGFLDTLWMEYDTDTLYCRNILFRAKDDSADYYEWHIGSETIVNQRAVQRNDFPVDQDFSVTLVIRKKPNLSCFVDDKGVDTVRRSFHVLGTTKQISSTLPWIGKFHGNSNDAFGERTVEVRILPTLVLGDTIYGRVSVVNLIPNCTTVIGGDNFTQHAGETSIFKELLFGVVSDNRYWCRGVAGVALVSPTNRDSVTITYSYRTNPNDSMPSARSAYQTFKGSRVK